MGTEESYFSTSECVSPGHPDKVCDVIADTILDACLGGDKKSRVACEVLVKNNVVVLAGEITTTTDVNFEKEARKGVAHAGYREDVNGFSASSAFVMNLLTKQSPEISAAVGEDSEGAGDQGVMCGMATDETPDYMPTSMWLSRKLINTLIFKRQTDEDFKEFLPDAKVQITVKHDKTTKKPVRVESVVLSTHHKPSLSITKLREIVKDSLVPGFLSQVGGVDELFDTKTNYIINPSGAWTFGGPAADCGVTNRKIVVDQYGPDYSVGGGGLHGKDMKPDRIGAYMARYIAKNIVCGGIAKKAKVKIGYVIGMKDPCSLNIDLSGVTQKGNQIKDINSYIRCRINLTPKGIIERLNLQKPIYTTTAIRGHFGYPCVFNATTGAFEYPWEQVDAELFNF